MVNRYSFRNLSFDNFKLITWLQIFIIAISTNLIFYQEAKATTVGAEGWSVSKRLVQGATTFYDGTKNIVINGKNYAAKGTAAVTPVAGQVAKMIVRTGAVLAVDLAIKALIGSVSYVMDPANNQVKYSVANDPNQPDPTSEYIYSRSGGYAITCGQTPNVLPSLSTAVADAVSCYNKSKSGSYTTQVSGNSFVVMFKNNQDPSDIDAAIYSMTANPIYDPNAEPDNSEKYLPYDAVASQIISDALAEKADGKAYVSSVADTSLDDEQNQIVPANNLIQQLNQSQAIPTNGTATGAIAPPTTVDPTTGEPVTPKPSDLTLNFPEFCGWAPTICQAAQSAINFPGTVAEYWEKTDKWMTEEPTDTSDTKPEIKDLQLNFDDADRVTFSQACPQSQPIEVTFMGVSQNAIFSYEPLCNFMTMIRPFVIGAAYLIGAYIVMGLSRGSSE